MTRTVLIIACAALPAAWLGGCATGPYDGSYLYRPRPASVAVVDPADGETVVAQVMVSVVGLRRADPGQDLPASMDIRWRLESQGDAALGVDPASLSLMDGSLRAFPAPRLEPQAVQDVAPGQSVTIDASFPFPGKAPGDYDLSGLNVAWTVRVGGAAVPGNQTFGRAAIYRGYPGYPYYGNPHFGYRFGVGYSWYH